jgi:mannose-6-phosphate isomerase-like protein (cupin superfamily)
VQDIEGLAVKNDEFRRVLYTAKHCQLVLMALKAKEEIGAEVHKLDQFFRVEEGTGEAVLDGVRTDIRAGFAVVVPAGTKHNIINTGSVPLKLYTLYAPPNHRDGVVHHTRADAEADNEHFDGKTTEEAVSDNEGHPTMSTITTRDGTVIYYEDWGSGQPVVFSHGWPLCADAWESQMVYLASKGYRCLGFRSLRAGVHRGKKLRLAPARPMPANMH